MIYKTIFTITYQMHLYTYEELLEERTYTKEEVLNAALIFHPGKKGYNITADQIAHVFEEGSNLLILENPIFDERGNEYRDSEGFYMARRTDDLEIKKRIAFHSKVFGKSRGARELYELEQDKVKRAGYMREAITHKFNNNPLLREKLLVTNPLQIIEYTYRKDVFFGIDQDTMTGQNVLGKLQMEYRDNYGLK